MADKVLTQDYDHIGIEEEIKQSYLDYAMSVIVGRALPDVRDGLKPVHRRVLYAMHRLKNYWNKPHKKSARIVGDVIGKYHPHGDKAVYDTIVRMAQDFSMRYMLLDGQGNFGSVDGDMAAAMRYTEVRLARIAQAFLDDLDKETVDFGPNYDGSEQVPDVLPTLIPNLLVNGSSGIAVGMATNIPTHNLAEVVDGVLALIADPELSIDELMKYIPAPDFPTGAYINSGIGIEQAYRTGRGGVYMRAKHRIEEADKRVSIIVEEIPYRVNKAVLLERIALLVNMKKIDSIADLRDESNKEGIRIVIELRRDAVVDVVVNNLFRYTDLETRFAINMVALVDGRPRLLNLKSILNEFIKHRRDVVTRRTIFLLKQAQSRGHILEGLALALANVDEVIALIKAAVSAAEAKKALMRRDWAPDAIMKLLNKTQGCRPDDLGAEYGLIRKRTARYVYKLSSQQAQAILDLRLQRLTSMEREKLQNEYKETLARVAEYIGILANPDKMRKLICKGLQEVRDLYGDPRRSQIISERRNLSTMELIKPEGIVVLLSHQGYIKAQTQQVFRVQKRGGMGITATSVKEEDYVEQLVTANSHDTLLCFSNLGRVYWLKCYELPQSSRQARGKPLVNFLPLGAEERIVSMLPWLELRSKEQGQREDVSDKFIILAMADGRVKRIQAQHFAKARRSGINVMAMNGGELIGAIPTDGQDEIFLISSAGKAVRTAERNFRPQGRAARGVRGIRLNEGQQLVAILPTRGYDYLLTVVATGQAKRTKISAFPCRGRGGKGMTAMGLKRSQSHLVGACTVHSDDEIMVITSTGRLIRTPVNGISVQGRTAGGVGLAKINPTEERIEGLGIIKNDLAAETAQGEVDEKK